MPAQLIYKSYNTSFNTSSPVYFYGMPDRKILVLFTRAKEKISLTGTYEWVLAEHLDLWFDFESDAIMDSENRKLDFVEFMEFAEKLEQCVKPLKTFGSFSTQDDAQQYFKKIYQMQKNLNLVKAILN